MAKLIDLDAAVEHSDLDVQIGGVTYKVPGEIDVPRMLRWMRYEDRFKDEADGTALVEEVYSDILALFRIRQPSLESLPISLTQIGELFSGLFSAYDAEEEAAPPTRGQTRSRKSSARSGSQTK